ncbi:flagellar basal-body rod protein FlgC [Acidovorax sp. Leaf84]|uniref:flagellar basal body rod protein FlgC n=1 Tax=Acidovorax sp. Leaf84 TaxID=1736240 RepID=UPI0006F96530|nr:flagellar basal body rod protein FlgC [Acidovorax sp. Leaf84]KQO35423.1 flagellar basal-body rod protein FlgC [Acidovorax sp. Leaf84]
MNYAQTFAISAGGMAVERSRVEVAALNLANANTVAGPDGQVYRPMKVVARTAFGAAVEQGLSAPTMTMETSPQPPRMAYEPAHPMANAQGFVAYAAVDTAAEMVTLMNAMRSYEANVAAMNTSRSLALKSLEIGGSQ